VPDMVVIGAPVRGTGTQEEIVLSATRIEVTKGWGAQPAQARIEWVASEAIGPIVPGASVTITLGGHTFRGISPGSEAVEASDGSVVSQEFVDYREFLTWDTVFGAFNLKDVSVVAGRMQRTFRHLLPANARAGVWTVTDAPYTAGEILALLFTAPTVDSHWGMVPPPPNGAVEDALAMPVYDLDWSRGTTLGAAAQEVSQRAGLTFTVDEDYTLPGADPGFWLAWVVKGVGVAPAIPALSDQRRQGLRLSGHPSRITVVGDRNQYHVLDVKLMPDWAAAWQGLWDIDLVTWDLYDHEKDPQGVYYKPVLRPGGSDTASTEAYLRAAQRARTITVAEYAALRDARSAGSGDAYRDTRWFGGRSRMHLPVALYLTQVLYRCYRVAQPNEYTGSDAAHGGQITNIAGVVVPLAAWEVDDRAVAATLFDPGTGVMTPGAETDEPGPGLGVVQGAQLLSTLFDGLNWESCDVSKWTAGDATWGQAAFQVEPAGDGSSLILFEEPILALGALVDYTTAAGYPVMKRTDGPYAQPAKAALTFRGEVCSYLAGTGGRDGIESAPGLNGQWVVGADGALTEIPYADGTTAAAKAAAIAAVLLARPWTQVAGGWQYAGSAGQALGPMLDRVSVAWSDQGLAEAVDFASERPYGADGLGRPILEAPRDFQRRLGGARLLPVEAELRAEARDLGVQARLLRGRPAAARTVRDAVRHTLGLSDPLEYVLRGDASEAPVAEWLTHGTPLWREGAAGRAVQASARGLAAPPTQPVFVGATVLETIEVADGGRPVAVTRGRSGVVLVRVRPAAAIPTGETVTLPANTLVGYAAGEPYLVPVTADTPEAPALGRTQRQLTFTTADNTGTNGHWRGQLVPVALSAGGGGGGGAARLGIIQDASATDQDYVTVLVAGGTEVEVALPWPLRHDQAPSGAHFIMPPYANGQLLYIQEFDGTGVVISGTELTWGDVTPGRGWAATFQVCSTAGGEKYADLVSSAIRNEP
jgi:hypothetical protein